jgi:hypothetical protein
MLVMIDTDCIGSYKSNYHTFTTTTAPVFYTSICVQYTTNNSINLHLFCTLLSQLSYQTLYATQNYKQATFIHCMPHKIINKPLSLLSQLSYQILYATQNYKQATLFAIPTFLPNIICHTKL